jgi:uncharacterized RDD family membrane protein YckC
MPRNALPPPPLDTRYRIETPEGIDLTLRPAGLVVRALAFGVDLLIRGLLLGALFALLSALGSFGLGLGALLMFLVNWWYMVLFEVLNQGRSPGKALLGLRVVQDDGTPIGWSASLLRNLLRFVDLLPFGYFFGALCSLQHPAFKRLGDLAAGTLVVYVDTPPGLPALPDVDPINPPFPLTRAEEHAVLAFAERQHTLSGERAAELAAIVAQPLQVPAEQAVATLNGIARGLLGAR